MVRAPEHRDSVHAHWRVHLDLPDPRRAGRRGLPPAGDVGRLHHHLRLLDRYWTRGNADLRHSLSLPRGIPHEHLPRGGGDDGVRGDDGRSLPDPAPGTPLEVLLADSLPELAAHLAESQEPARV